MSKTELYFLKKARELKSVEQEFIKYTYETKTPEDPKTGENFFRQIVKLAFRASDLRNEIRGEMHDVSDVQIIDPDARRTIEKVKAGERFESIAFAESVAVSLNKNIDDPLKHIETGLDFYFSNQYEELEEDFFSWFYLPGYYYNRALCGSIITPSKLPPNIIEYFDEIKEAYAFGLEKACISLCRALLEIALYEKLKSKGAFKKGMESKASNVIDISKEDTLMRLIVIAKQKNIISNNYKEVAHEIRKRGNNVLHLKDTNEYSVKGLALKTITDTVVFIEHLYR